MFTSEDDAMIAIKRTDPDRINPLEPDDVMVLIGYGPLGQGMPETFQITRALKDTHCLNPLLTDGRFSGVSTGACIGHIGPEALAGGPIGKLRDGDILEIEVDTKKLTGSINFIGIDEENIVSPEDGAVILSNRSIHPDVKQNPNLPSSVKIWAAEQNACGGTWGGCYRDSDTLVDMISHGMLSNSQP
jgi:dihydroxyacid dehydratase/phosphogluconate dehydratase